MKDKVLFFVLGTAFSLQFFLFGQGKEQAQVCEEELKKVRREFSEYRQVNALPVGAIVAYDGDGTTLPDNWVLCDGRTINISNSPYNGRKVPKLAGYFIRGKESSESLGYRGGDDYIDEHSHSISSHYHGLDGHSHSLSISTTELGYSKCDYGFGIPCSEGMKARYVITANTEREFKEITAHSHSGTADYASSGYTHSGGSGLSDLAGGHSNIPEYKAFNYIIKIK